MRSDTLSDTLRRTIISLIIAISILFLSSYWDAYASNDLQETPIPPTLTPTPTPILEPTPTPSDSMGVNAIEGEAAVPLGAVETAGGRGFDPDYFYATYFNSADLRNFVASEPYSSTIDFYLNCEGETDPYAGCKLIDALSDGRDFSVQ